MKFLASIIAGFSGMYVVCMGIQWLQTLSEETQLFFCLLVIGGGLLSCLIYAFLTQEEHVDVIFTKEGKLKAITTNWFVRESLMDDEDYYKDVTIDKYIKEDEC